MPDLAQYSPTLLRSKALEIIRYHRHKNATMLTIFDNRISHLILKVFISSELMVSQLTSYLIDICFHPVKWFKDESVFLHCNYDNGILCNADKLMSYDKSVIVWASIAIFHFLHHFLGLPDFGILQICYWRLRIHLSSVVYYLNVSRWLDDFEAF